VVPGLSWWCPGCRWLAVGSGDGGGDQGDVGVVFSELRNADLMVQMSPQLRGPNEILKAKLGLR
jgi:hypothetical protein